MFLKEIFFVTFVTGDGNFFLATLNTHTIITCKIIDFTKRIAIYSICAAVQQFPIQGFSSCD